MTESELIQQALTIVAVLVVPGLILNWVSGLRLPWAVAAAIPTTCGVVGFAGWLLSRMHVLFNLTNVGYFFAAVVGLAALWRLMFIVGRLARRRRKAKTQAETQPDAGADAEVENPRWWRQWFSNGSLFDPRWILPGAGVIAGAWVLIQRLVELYAKLPNQMLSIVQGWDVHWHASEVRYIVEEGMADSTRMGEAHNLDGKAELFYPSGWHAVAALLSDVIDVEPIAALNWMNVILPSVALPLSVALIAWRLVGNRGLVAQIAAGSSAALVICATVLYWIPTYVGMWPYLGSISMVGIVAALFMSVPAVPIRMFAAVVGFIGLVIMHPAPVTIVIVMLGLWWLFDVLWRPTRTSQRENRFVGGLLVRLRDLGLLAIAGAVGIGLLLPQLLAGVGQSGDVQAVSAYEDITWSEAWYKTFFMHTRHVGEFKGMEDWLWLLILAGFGAVALLFWRKNIWGPLFVLISALLTVNSLKALPTPWNQILDTIGGLHYGTAHRLVIPVAMFLFAYAGVGFAVLVRLAFAGFIKHRVWSKISAVLSISLAVGLVAWYQPMAVASVTKGSKWVVEGMYGSNMVNEKDLKAFDWLAKQPKAYDGLIFGEHADGYGWMYAYNALPSVSRHYLWPTLAKDAPTHKIHNSAYLIGAGNYGDPDQRNLADDAVDKLGVNYIFISPPNFWHFQHTNLELSVKTESAPGLTLVYRDGLIRIYAVNDHFTDAELTKMRSSGSPEALPPLPTKARSGQSATETELAADGSVGADSGRGVGSGSAAMKPYYHRPTKPAAPVPGEMEITERDAVERQRDDAIARNDRALLRH